MRVPSPFDLPQDAAAFNQPLSFDTSGVTSMSTMFEVRPALSTIQPLPSLFPSCKYTYTTKAYSLSLSLLSALPSSRFARVLFLHSLTLPALTPPFDSDSAQDTHAFNQPLSLDTSKVTEMGYMFAVRSARVPCMCP